MSVQPLFTPVRMGELDLPNSYRHGTAHPHARWADRSHADRAAGRILCSAGFGRTDRRGSDRDQSPDHVMREGRGQSSRSCRVSRVRLDGVRRALTRGLAVHPRGLCLCRAAESFLATLSMVS
jgi:hypothetical protein